ncbi:hypothetical protein [Actinoplanes subtropicus]|uniref:hypothetical protein n=1 Tax=Actinoplanes subtropicus TaxID=543632 RepID=UPI0012F881AE|nr:hypothetical protein [Actinoplanes subtropicus]
MLDTGGGGGGTPWESMTLHLMQRLIQNPDVQAHWQLVEAWNKSAQLLGDHLWQMQEYRSNLAAVWPPQKSPAAAVYLDRLDELISNVKETYEASIANHRAFSAVTGSIHQAQAQMRKIYQEYQISRTAQNGSTPTAQVHQEQLRLQAVKLLSSVSTDLAVAQSQIVKPAPYARYRKKGKDSTPVGGDGELVAPPLPRITPSVSNDRDAAKSTRTAVPSVGSAPASGAPQPGLILGGTTQPPTPTFSPVNPVLPGGADGPVTGPGLVPPSTALPPRLGQPLAPPVPGGRRGGDVARGGITEPGVLPEGEMRSGPSGGLIGGMPGYGGGREGSGRSGARRMNPVGGTISGGDRSQGSRRGVGGGYLSGVYGQAPPGGRQGRAGEAGSKRWDPNNPWETAVGVDPVVLPPPELPIDPGPAIGLE